MDSVSEKHLEEFVCACHLLASHGLLQCSSGNLSWRVDKEKMVITATRAWMANITKEQVVVCRISDGTILNGRKPSEEIGFHLGILRERSDVNVVLHFQTPCATAIACCARDVMNFSIIPEVPFYIGQIAEVPYMDPGSENLSRAVISAMEEHDLVIMKNHGQVTVGKSFNDVIQKATFFELACEIILLAGKNIQFLSDDAINRLR